MSLTEEQLQRTIESAVNAARQQWQQETPPQPQRTPEPPPQQNQQPDPFSQIADDDLVDGRTVKELGYNIQQRLSNYEEALRRVYGVSTGQLETASRMENREIWEKYGPEIRQEIERRKEYKLLEPADYDEVVDLIRGRHYRDFIEEEAKRFAANAPEGDISTGAAGTGTMTADEDRIPEHWQDILKQRGLNLNEVKAMLERRRVKYGENISLSEYLHMLDRDKVIVTTRGGIESEDLTTGARRLQNEG